MTAAAWWLLQDVTAAAWWLLQDVTPVVWRLSQDVRCCSMMTITSCRSCSMMTVTRCACCNTQVSVTVFRCDCRSWIHERTISLRFLDIILRVLTLEVSIYNVYITNQFQTTVAQGVGVKSYSKEENSLDFVPITYKDSASGAWRLLQVVTAAAWWHGKQYNCGSMVTSRRTGIELPPDRKQ